MSEDIKELACAMLCIPIVTFVLVAFVMLFTASCAFVTDFAWNAVLG